MSLKKNQSITSDTRATGSLNPSIQPRMARQLQLSQNCEVQFLRRKNAQLNERVGRMTEHIGELQKSKKQLLGELCGQLELNQKYIRVVNEYYRHGGRDKQNNKRCGNNILAGLQKDHRNLVKHCLTMQQQIMYSLYYDRVYTKEMQKFNQMKQQLRSVNHTNTRELIQELRELTIENRELKKENNQLSYDLEKSRQEGCRLRSGKEKWQAKADLEGDELEKCKALINTLTQQNTDASSAYEAKIYELQIKVSKLQEQLRREQEVTQKNTEARRALEMASVEYVHERARLHRGLRDKQWRKNSRANSFILQ